MVLKKKVIAVILALALVLTIAGCGAVPITFMQEWSYRDSEKSLSIGVYVYSLYNAYSKAAEYAKEAEGYEENKSFLELTITDDDGNTAKAEDWIYAEAKRNTKMILAVEAEVRSRGLVASQDEIDSAKETAKSDWNVGPYAQFYAQMGYSSTPMKTVLEPYGISYESYLEAGYFAGIYQNLLFKDIYEIDGTQAVTNKEITEYFEENYTNYSYFKIDLSEGQIVTTEADTAETTLAETTEEPTTVEDPNAEHRVTEEVTEATTAPPETTMVEFSDSKKAKIKNQFDKYADSINSGKKSYDDIVKQYEKDYSIDEGSSTSTSNTENLEDSTSIPDALKDALKDLGEGKATIVKDGEGAEAAYYLVFKGKIKDKTSEYLEGDKRSGLVVEMRRDEFTVHAKKLTEDYDCEENENAMKAYKPNMFESFVETTESDGSDDEA